MKSLDYLEHIKNEHNLTDTALLDILEHIGYIARDNNMDDEIMDALIEEIENKGDK